MHHTVRVVTADQLIQARQAKMRPTFCVAIKKNLTTFSAVSPTPTLSLISAENMCKYAEFFAQRYVVLKCSKSELSGH
jgi:hypothetical protein